MDLAGTTHGPSHHFAQLRLSRPGKQTLPAPNPQLIVFQIHLFNLVRRHQIGPVRADKAVSQFLLQLVEASQKIHPAVGRMEQNMVGGAGCFKKEDIVQRDVAHGLLCPQGEHLRRVLALRQQPHMNFPQAPGHRRSDLLRLLYNVVKGLQMVLEGAPGQIAIAGDIDQRAVRVPPPQRLPQPEPVPFPIL